MTEPMTVERLEELRQIAAVHNSNMMDELIREVGRLRADNESLRFDIHDISSRIAEEHAEAVRQKARAEQAEAERDKYVHRYGCLSCGEVHDGICPPHEVRTTGMAALRTPQALRAADAEARRQGVQFEEGE